MKVSVFGGSQPKPGEQAYQEAMQLGSLLGAHGHTVLTGGYIGTMEAVSRGAHEAGGHVIGVTCAEIERWRTGSANRWVIEQCRMETLVERLQYLVQECDVGIALPGGPGTLTEICLMWTLMIVESMHRRPLVLVGNGWQSVFDQLFKVHDLYIPTHQRELVRFAKDVQTAVNLIENGE